ncbi:MAG: hypothetical protein HFJ17_01470 [Clostridia bacterium]|nr:hypothetical protein [Clostridia bacterium]
MDKKIVNKQRKIKNKNILKICLIILVIVIAIISIKNVKKNEVTDKMSLIINNEEVTDKLKDELIKKEDVVYISFEDAKNLIDKTIYLEEKSGLIITSSEKKIATLKLDEKKLNINGSNIFISGQAFKNEKGIIYLPISEMENVYDMDFTSYKDSNIVTIDYYSKKLVKAYTKKKVSIKSEKRKFGPTIEKVKKGNWLIYISEESGWAKVRTQSGKMGYIKSKYLTNFVTEREDMINEEQNKNIDKYLEKDVSKKNLTTYTKRHKIINQILLDIVNKDSKGVIITCNYKDKKGLDRFKTEIKPVLKECGIDVIFK